MKEEEKDEVVELEVEVVREEKVKEEVDENVVVAKIEGGGVAEGFFGRPGGEGHHGPTLGPRRPDWPPTPKPRPPPPGPPGESNLNSPFFYAPRASQNFGAGELGVGGCGGDPPRQTLAAGGPKDPN